MKPNRIFYFINAQKYRMVSPPAMLHLLIFAMHPLPPCHIKKMSNADLKVRQLLMQIQGPIFS